MNFAPAYLLGRFVYRIIEFFHHWYIDGSRSFAYWVVNFFEQIDQIFALKVTAKHFFHPLYKDYTIVGRILGVIFRTGRIVVASVLYCFLAVVFFSAYVVWLVTPVFLLLASVIHL